MKRVSPLVTVAGNDVMHFQQGGKSILRRLTFATLFMRRQEQNAKKNLTKKKLRCYTSEVFFKDNKESVAARCLENCETYP